MSEALDPKLIARIKKLHNMAEGAKAVGSLAEADSFMEAVNKTLAAHNLDMSVLNVELHDLTDPMGVKGVVGVGSSKKSRHRHSGKPIEWVVDLATAVADAHYCACNYSVSSSYIFFYGRASNRETAIKMFTYLRDLAETLGWRAYAKEVQRRRDEYGSARNTGAWRLDWLDGFATEVSARYRTMRARVESDKGTSLVLTSVRKEAYDASLKDIRKDGKPVEFIESNSFYEEARDAGKKAASAVNLRPSALDAAPATPRQLK